MNKIILALLLSGLNCVCSTAQSIEQKVTTAVTKDMVESTIHFLASDELKGRDTGTEEQVIAAKYLAALLQSWGVRKAPGMSSYLQEVPLEAFYPPTAIAINGGELQVSEGLLAWDAVNGTTTAKVAMAGFGLASDYEGKDLKDRLVVVRGGTPDKPVSSGQDVRMKMELAKKAGAAGVIEIATLPASQWAFYSNFMQKEQLSAASAGSDMPYLWLNDPSKAQIAKLQALEDKPVTIEMAGASKKNVIAYNVVGYLPGTDPGKNKEHIVLSGHYDHVGIGRANVEGDSIYNGARDNAVGVVAVLSAARMLAAMPAQRPFLFVAFTGEEKGMIGSKYFVEHSPVPLHQIVFNLNNDNAGYNDKTIATVVGLSRTNVKEQFEKGCAAFGLRAVEDPAPEQNLFDRSDNVQFAKEGIPAPTFSLGFTSFDAEIGKYYHQAADNPETLDYDYLTSFFRSFAYTAYLIGNMKATPFWTEGDKYYDTGKKLYSSGR